MLAILGLTQNFAFDLKFDSQAMSSYNTFPNP